MSLGAHGEDFRGTTRDQLRALHFFDARAVGYGQRVQRGPLRYLRERERAAILDLCRLDEAGPRTVLDVGCGDGFYSRRAKQAGKWVHAIDIAAAMVEQVRGRVDCAEVADLESFDPGRTYDIVICSGVLEFVPCPGLAFGRLCALVAPAGRLVVQVPRAGWPGLLYRLEKGLHGIRVNLFSLGWLQDRARHHGLQPKRWLSPLPTNLALLLERA